jgi:glycosyltransferase involved in cell wall biosynthesis
MIAIVTATYQRPDGSTPFYLSRALESIYNQTCQDFQLYLIGDAYKDNRELMSIISNYPFIKCVNLERSAEREKYPFGDHRLWCCGGLSAVLKGISWALSDGAEHVCHLDHDDWWEKDHLEKIAGVIKEKNPLFVCTLSTYKGGVMPRREITNETIEWIPVPGGLIASSACVKYSATKLRGRDCFAETGEAYPGDADLWLRLASEMKTTGRKGYVITSLTCHHDQEGYVWSSYPSSKSPG